MSARLFSSLLLLALSASALVVSPGHNHFARDSLASRHGHHAMMARSSPAEVSIKRRGERFRKRCVERGSSSSSSFNVAAAPSSSSVDTSIEVVLPTTTTTPPAPETTTYAPAPETTTAEASNPPSSGGSEISGEGTYFNVGLGACGKTSVDSDFIAAASRLLFDGFEGYAGSDPNSNPICGRQALVSFGGSSVTVTILDRCPECAYGDLDLSPAAFEKLAAFSVGRIRNISWHFI